MIRHHNLSFGRKTWPCAFCSVRTVKLIAACVLAAGLLAPISLVGQGTTASLGGTVTDMTGAVVPGAQVELKNEATHVTRTSVSNGSGVFSFSALPVGDYDIQITSQGFSNFQQRSIHLDPGDQKTVRDIHLAVGSSSQTVEVTSAADQINLDSGEQSSLISAQEIQHLSVEGRDVTELLKILPGFAISKGGAGSFDNSQYDPAQVNPPVRSGSMLRTELPLTVRPCSTTAWISPTPAPSAAPCRT